MGWNMQPLPEANSIDRLIKSYPDPLKEKDRKYLERIRDVYQQKQMYDTKSQSVENRIVSIHQPHVRPIARGNTTAKVEFGAKIHVSFIDGISLLDELSWDAFHEEPI
jgi:transposase, IS5 family